MRQLARSLLLVVGSAVFGVTVWYAAYGSLRAHFGLVVVGTLLTLGAVFVGCVMLEEPKQGERQ